jgi:hypothetical protein
MVEVVRSFVDFELGPAAAAFVTYRPLTAAFRTKPFQLFALFLAINFALVGTMPLLPIPVIESFLQTAESYPTRWTGFLNAVGTNLTALMLGIGAIDALMHSRLDGTRLVKCFGAIAVWWFIMNAIIAHISAVHSDWVLAFGWSCRSLNQAPMAYSVLVNEASWMVSFLVCGSLLVVACIVFFLFKQPTGYEGCVGLFGVLVSGIGILALILRRRAVLSARAAVNNDRRSYDEVWNVVRMEQESELRVLAWTVGQQRVNAKKLQPSQDAERLLHLAYCLTDWYQELVRLWAAHLRVVSQPAPMKSPKRMMQKIFRSYRGRPEYVTDIVRSTIICNTICEVQRVLDYVIKNSVVHTIKNRFDLNYSGDDTGGYRDMNMQLSFADLDGTAFQGFVFELQVHFKGILERKHAEGHRRYVVLRNIKGD